MNQGKNKAKSRMEGRYSELWRSLRNDDFEEEDVWAVLKDTTEDNSTKKFGNNNSNSNESFNSFSRTNHPSTSRTIPKATRSISSSSSYYDSTNESHLLHQSEPMNIPQWSKIYGEKSKKVSWHDNDHETEDDDGDDDDGRFDNESVDDDDEFEAYGKKLPPHEYIARKLARSQISSFSVFEGVGRTLKGRDLSKVRNAVLTKTGFLESL